MAVWHGERDHTYGNDLEVRPNIVAGFPDSHLHRSVGYLYRRLDLGVFRVASRTEKEASDKQRRTTSQEEGILRQPTAMIFKTAHYPSSG